MSSDGKNPHERAKQPDDLLTLGEVAQEYGVAYSTVYNWCAVKNLLPHERVGPFKAYRVRRHVVDTYRETLTGASL